MQPKGQALRCGAPVWMDTDGHVAARANEEVSVTVHFTAEILAFPEIA